MTKTSSLTRDISVNGTRGYWAWLKAARSRRIVKFDLKSCYSYETLTTKDVMVVAMLREQKERVMYLWEAFGKQNVSNRTTMVGWKRALSVEADLSGWDLHDALKVECQSSSSLKGELFPCIAAINTQTIRYICRTFILEDCGASIGSGCDD
ncbi:hypothetical protein Tco_0741770 [Tanacetum coccineum]